MHPRIAFTATPFIFFYLSSGNIFYQIWASIVGYFLGKKLKIGTIKTFADLTTNFFQCGDGLENKYVVAMLEKP